MKYGRTLIFTLTLLLWSTTSQFIFAKAETPTAPSSESFGDRDLIAFWAGTQVFLNRQNPYDQELVLRQQRRIYPSKVQAQAFLNPPWSLPIFSVLFSSTDLHQSRIAWIFLNLVLIMTALLTWLNILKRKSIAINTSVVATLAGTSLLFLPVWFCLDMGQLTIFLLAALVACLFFLQTDRYIFAGICLSMLTIKPHIFLPLFTALTVWAFYQRKILFLSSTLLAFLAMVMIPVLWVPDIYTYWLNNSFVSTDYVTGTLAAMLRALILYLTGHLPIYPLFLLPVCGCLLAVYLVVKKINIFDCVDGIESILLLTIITAPYAWFYDYSLLVPLQWTLLAISFQGYIDMPTRRFIIMGLLLVQILPLLTNFFSNNLGFYVVFPIGLATFWAIFTKGPSVPFKSRST